MRWLSIPIFVLAACAADLADKGPEDDVPGDLDKADSQRSPTDLGTIASGATVTGTLSSSARYLAWELDVPADADLSFDTSRAAHAASVDTVLYLYRATGSGWGSYIARNDDAGDSMFSSIDKHVAAGRYRVLVKGYKTTTYGSFQLTYACAGCTVTPVCAFGDTFHDIDPAKFTITGPVVLHASSTISSLEGQQIVRALHASTHTDVTTPADAFAAADQGEIDEYQLVDVAAVRRFTAFEYGAGDNSYGAIFARATTDVATEIHDGDLYGCNVHPAVCVFGHAANDYVQNASLTIGTTINYSSASRVAAAVQPEIVAALRAQRPQVGAIEEVWALVDGGTVRRVDVTHADGRAYTIITYGLGGQTYGAAFVRGTNTRAVSILAGATQDCSAF
ncbi:MAG TPA: DVUA0089 family protein [Kofleriaceae bacterium]|nr:DVUA0089 family protein [Kofleriaceae bacterium]